MYAWLDALPPAAAPTTAAAIAAGGAAASPAGISGTCTSSLAGRSRLTGSALPPPLQVFVGPFLKRQDRPGANKDASYTNVYIKNLDNSTTDEEFVEMVAKFGPYSSAVVQRVSSRSSRGSRACTQLFAAGGSRLPWLSRGQCS
jgi:hypothetical protein